MKHLKVVVNNIAKCGQCNTMTNLGGYTQVLGRIVKFRTCGQCRENNRIKGGGVPSKAKRAQS